MGGTEEDILLVWIQNAEWRVLHVAESRHIESGVLGLFQGLQPSHSLERLARFCITHSRGFGRVGSGSASVKENS